MRSGTCARPVALARARRLGAPAEGRMRTDASGPSTEKGTADLRSGRTTGLIVSKMIYVEATNRTTKQKEFTIRPVRISIFADAGGNQRSVPVSVCSRTIRARVGARHAHGARPL